MKRRLFVFLTGLLSLALQLVASADHEYEQAPIHYSKTAPSDAAQELQKKWASGEVVPDRSDAWALMRQLMAFFEIPEASQVLVFSKTSKQNNLIHPLTPRAIYFGDNAYIGYCQGGSIEVTTIDPVLGPIFYLLEPDTSARRPLRFERDQSCLSCHGGPFSPDVPGVLVRSVFPGREGHPVMSQGSTVVGTATPFSDRWGGWYVTGSHGEVRHRGNLTIDDRADDPQMDRESGANLVELSHLFDTRPYPLPSSDIVALMVLEHQCATQNILTKANHSALRAMHRQQSLQREMGETVEEGPVGTAERIIDNSVATVLDALFFYEEAALPDGGIEGGPGFQTAFAASARRASSGRSLKDFQLLNRLFKYRCSYMIYSITFQHLTPVLRDRVMNRLVEVLEGRDPSERYGYLGERERAHIRAILAETLDGVPDDWKTSGGE
jgi:hypothetical protein